MLPSSVTPDGSFRVGIHKPSYRVENRRKADCPLTLGLDSDGNPIDNRINFVSGDVVISEARPIYEIRNPFPFRGCTFIDSGWAESRAAAPESICIAEQTECSLLDTLKKHVTSDELIEVMAELPRSVRYSIAQNSKNAEELVMLAASCCKFIFDEHNNVSGLSYISHNQNKIPEIEDSELFETIANNPALPDEYKKVMVLRPGVQGSSEIVGDFSEGDTEIFEYLRGNSYIPWGHFAANFSHNSIRYSIDALSQTDMQGLRHLYYQRMYLVLAQKLGVEVNKSSNNLSREDLEILRRNIVETIVNSDNEEVATLWGWTFGYDFSGSGYRLHASHQMIHQQYAMVPAVVKTTDDHDMSAFSSGDMVADFIEQYRASYGTNFFPAFLSAIRDNNRIDGKEGESSLIVWEDDNVILFVPKAQVSQWELQLIVIADGEFGPVGNIIEADENVRRSLDIGILKAQQTLATIGARMVTSIEYTKRIGINNGQRLLYSFLPKLPWSMGAFSEAQQRYICGHYPEDFAFICRQKANYIS